MTPPATAADIVVIAPWPRLIVSGSSAEQPSPAMPKTATESQGMSSGRAAVRKEGPDEHEREEAEAR